MEKGIKLKKPVRLDEAHEIGLLTFDVWIQKEKIEKIKQSPNEEQRLTEFFDKILESEYFKGMFARAFQAGVIWQEMNK